MNSYKITAPGGKLQGEISLPASKSISNRVLIIRALSGSDFRIDNLSDANDTVILERLLSLIEQKKGSSSIVEINAGDAGTVMRFLAAYLSRMPGKWVLTGTARMKQRPIGILVDGLKFLGADIEFLGKIGYPPVLIKGKKLSGKEIVVDPEVSSQFVSALIMTGPVIPGGLRMHIAGHPVSQPYIEMTIRLLEYFGVKVTRDRTYIRIPEEKFIPSDFTVEADWSSAAFWYMAAALSSDADILLKGLKRDSIQGDAALADIFSKLGVTSEFVQKGVRIKKKGSPVSSLVYNFNDHPDIAPAVILTCAALGIEGDFEGLESLRIKESDRLAGLISALNIPEIEPENYIPGKPQIKFGAGKISFPRGLVLNSSGDHRMAMTYAMLSCVTGNIIIEDADVVQKSYPRFWNDIASLGFKIS